VHIKRIFSLCGAIVAAVALVSASGATTTKNHNGSRIDVSSRAAIVHYLRSIHVNPKGLVIQRGRSNYAGTRCPGKGWTCTRTTHPVVQIARAGGRNTFTCSMARCVVVQVAPASARPNKGVCIKTTGLTQSCVITQSSATADNIAVVYEDAGNKAGLTQTASYTASITQTATGLHNKNQACVHQAISLIGSTVARRGTPVNVSLEAHQSVTITQDAAGQDVAGNGNLAQDSAVLSATTANCTTDGTPLSQTQTLTSVATGSGPITQNENAAQNGANVALDIEQGQHPTGSGIGANNAIFDQKSNLQAVANTPAGQVTQTQSSFTGDPQSPLNGGIAAAVNQDSTGQETVDATQSETQCEDAAVSGLSACSTIEHANPFPDRLTQNQHGPVSNARTHRSGGHEPYVIHKHNGTQTGGNPADVFMIHQNSNQDSDSGSTQTNNLQADCLTPGNCTATQNTDINGTPSSNIESGQDIDTTTSCAGPSCTSTCTGPTCTFSQSGPQLTAVNTDFAEFGYGGMRVNTGTSGTPGTGTGSIAVSGIGGPVTKALLYWNGPTSSDDPNSNAVVSFANQSVTGLNIGTASSNCWNHPEQGVAYTNSQSYVADVTSLVAGGLTDGTGTFDLANFTKTDISNTVVADINGVALLVFYNDGNTANFRNVVLWSGNDSNFAFGTDPAGWDETLTGVTYPGSGTASLDFIVGDGQVFDDGGISINGTEVVPAGPIFQGTFTPHGPADAMGDLWDIHRLFPISLATGSNTLHVTSPLVSDCLSLVALAADTPASVEGPGSPVLRSPQALSGPSAHEVHPSSPTVHVPGGVR
jgi:hypothetical protein